MGGQPKASSLSSAEARPLWEQPTEGTGPKSGPVGILAASGGENVKDLGEPDLPRPRPFQGPWSCYVQKRSGSISLPHGVNCLTCTLETGKRLPTRICPARAG
jgi:hypothetical protein